MMVVDSSGWLEFLANEANAEAFAPACRHPRQLIVPTITIFEVYKRVKQQRTETEAVRVTLFMQLGRVEGISAVLAKRAADIALAHRMSVADSIIYATARRFGAELWTQDAHFQNLPHVRYFPKPT